MSTMNAQKNQRIVTIRVKIKECQISVRFQNNSINLLFQLLTFYKCVKNGHLGSREGKYQAEEKGSFLRPIGKADQVT